MASRSGLEAVVDIDDDDGDVGERATAGTEHREGVWPGVSMNSRPGRSKSVGSTGHQQSRNHVKRDGFAPMCCVIAPDSPAVTAEPPVLSSRLVFPWSTWPRTATMGVRGWRRWLS